VLGPSFRRQSGFDINQSSPNPTANGESTVRRNSWMTGVQLFLTMGAVDARGGREGPQGELRATVRRAMAEGAELGSDPEDPPSL